MSRYLHISTTHSFVGKDNCSLKGYFCKEILSLRAGKTGYFYLNKELSTVCDFPFNLVLFLNLKVTPLRVPGTSIGQA